ncbi:hypothetical protein LEP1GSC062_3082 [Leptospira alexanderi serovar Manhao 3 str. L 60]|uniref:Uncharacterized protein n=1 Tax=Leptospira alexanderi serovar Manhao 3 str. L 60 TaxID=1049759 RepID=V6HYM0_9LEPT|nr:hypothetical protein LEP1GSC062_3082 [Leptospira alexanderi serovar Manhao 3 str. L 60]
MLQTNTNLSEASREKRKILYGHLNKGRNLFFENGKDLKIIYLARYCERNQIDECNRVSSLLQETS